MKPSDRPDAVPTRRDDVTETLHGVAIVDPYRWLEDGESEDVRAWSAAQTARTELLLRARPGAEMLEAELEALLRVGAVEPPIRASRGRSLDAKPSAEAEAPVVTGPPRYFHRRQTAEQDQPVLFVREGLGGADRALVDPNQLSGDGTTSIDWWTPSWDGRFVAYGVSEGGDENSTLRVLDVETGRDLPSTEVIARTRYSTVAWLPDASGFFYARFPAKGTVPQGEERYHRRIYFHRIGRAAEHDPLVFGDGRAMTDTPSIECSPNGRWLVVSVHMGWSRRELYLADRSIGGEVPKFAPLAIPEGDALYEAIAYDDHLLVRTNDGAPTYALYRVDPEHPERENWRLLVPAGADVLFEFAEISEQIVVHALRDARSVLLRFDLDGAPVGEIPLPLLGTVSTLLADPAGEELFFHFTSFTVPARVMRFDTTTNELSTWAEIAPPIDPSEFVVAQERARSKDGTLVPMFVVHRRGLVLDGSAPTVLGGYGGFNINQLSAWSGGRYALLRRGGVSVLANLRGGGEYGEAWHRAGMLESKQNVFDDFYAVSEHLIARGYTSPDKLAILGGSNGGLLVGAAITQRPELFRAAVCMVPLLDMLRYHHFLIARLWIREYGSAEDAEQFQWLYAYSPYHHVEPGKRYPAVLFSTAEGDSRVDPLHARKMTARLQALGEDATRPILLRIESKAGHGAGKPISKRIDEAVAVYAFLFWQLGFEQP